MSILCAVSSMNFDKSTFYIHHNSIKKNNSTALIKMPCTSPILPPCLLQSQSSLYVPPLHLTTTDLISLDVFSRIVCAGNHTVCRYFKISSYLEICTFDSSMHFCGLIIHFFLSLHNILFSKCSRVYSPISFTYWGKF